MLFFWIRLKNASTLAFWLAALIVPFIIISIGMLFDRGQVAIQVGIYGDLQIESPGRMGELQMLAFASSPEWTLINYSDRYQLRQDVANMRLELGYAFGEESITLYTREATVANRVTNLLVAAAHLETVAGEVGAAILPFDADVAAIQARAEGYLADGPLMERIVLVHGDGVDEAEEYVPFRRLFHGLLALFAQLFAMLCALGFANKNEKQVLKRLRLAGSSVSYTLSGFAVVFAVSSVVLSTTIILGTWMFPGVWMASHIPAAIIYLAIVSGIAILLAIILPEALYTPLLIVGFIFTVLMGGVIFDLREVLEPVSFLRFLFPSHYYMQLILSY